MNKEQEIKLHKAIEILLGPKKFLLRCGVCGNETTIESYEEISFKDVQNTCRKCNNPFVFLVGRLVEKKDEIL